MFSLQYVYTQGNEYRLVSELSTRKYRAGDILFLASVGGSVAPNVIIMSRYCGFILQPEVTRDSFTISCSRQ